MRFTQCHIVKYVIKKIDRLMGKAEHLRTIVVLVELYTACASTTVRPCADFAIRKIVG